MVRRRRHIEQHQPRSGGARGGCQQALPDRGEHFRQSCSDQPVQGDLRGHEFDQRIQDGAGRDRRQAEWGRDKKHRQFQRHDDELNAHALTHRPGGLENAGVQYVQAGDHARNGNQPGRFHRDIPLIAKQDTDQRKGHQPEKRESRPGDGRQQAQSAQIGGAQLLSRPLLHGEDRHGNRQDAGDQALGNHGDQPAGAAELADRRQADAAADEQVRGSCHGFLAKTADGGIDPEGGDPSPDLERGEIGILPWPVVKGDQGIAEIVGDRGPGQAHIAEPEPGQRYAGGGMEQGADHAHLIQGLKPHLPAQPDHDDRVERNHQEAERADPHHLGDAGFMIELAGPSAAQQNGCHQQQHRDHADAEGGAEFLVGKIPFLDQEGRHAEITKLGNQGGQRDTDREQPGFRRRQQPGEYHCGPDTQGQRRVAFQKGQGQRPGGAVH